MPPKLEQLSPCLYISLYGNKFFSQFEMLICTLSQKLQKNPSVKDNTFEIIQIPISRKWPLIFAFMLWSDSLLYFQNNYECV